jgi:geranylgeranyl reductase family protein
LRERSTDVLVIGAGPAGAATALSLAARGVETVLVDRSEFPRDKVCGDALIPDALAALRTLGLEQAVCRRAAMIEELRVYAPSGSCVSFSGQCACLPRRELDHLILQAAIEAGASLLAPYSAAPMGRDRVSGAVLRHRESGEEIRLSARLTVLATGAGIDGIKAFDVVARRQPSAAAARAYFEVPARLARSMQHLVFSYEASTTPGYGWIFPGPDDVFNVGVVAFFDSKQTGRTRSLSDIWTAFLERSPARDLVRASTQVTPLRGAPLRTSMTGSRLFRQGLLVVGEAAGLTYSASGEGLGKAMASGIIAAELIADCFEKGRAADTVGPAYAARLTRDFGSRFRAYREVQRWFENPAFIDFLVQRGKDSAFARRRLEEVYNETSDPGIVISLVGMARSLVP